MGLDGADVKADLTKSPYLKITSSDAGILEIDPETGPLLEETRPRRYSDSFSEATAMVPAFVRPSKTEPAAAVQRPSNDIDGVWKACLRGLGGAPKMVSEIVFALDSSGMRSPHGPRCAWRVTLRCPMARLTELESRLP